MARITPNLVEGKQIFYPPTETLLTQTNVDLIDDVHTVTLLYPNAYTATLQDFYDVRAVRSVSSFNLAAGSRVAFAVFLPNQKAGSNCVFSCHGSLSYTGGANLRVWGVFGRIDGTTVGASLATVQNASTYFSQIPLIQSETITNGHHIYCFSCDIVNANAIPNTSPVYCGFVIENNTGSVININHMDSYISFQRFVDIHTVFSPIGN